MTRPPDTQQPHPPSEAGADEHGPAKALAAEPQSGEAAAPSRRTATINWAALGNGLLPTLLSAALVASMVFAFTSLDNRITSLDNRITSLENRVAGLENRITAFENRVDARFAAQDAKIDKIDAKIDEINLKLTALIAALNKTEQVDAALAGEITDGTPNASDQ